MNSTLKIILIACLLITLVFVLYYVSEIVAYIIIAGVISLLGRPIMSALESMHIGPVRLPGSICAVLTITFFYSIFSLFIAAFVPLIIEQVTKLGTIDIDALSASLAEPLNNLNSFLEQYRFTEPGREPVEILQEKLSQLLDMGNLTSLFNRAFGLLNNFVGVVIAIFSITFIAFFFLSDKDLLYNFVFALIPKQFETGFDNVVNTSKELLTRYIYGMVIQISAIAVFVTIGMFIIGVENALLIGLFAGFINIIPYLGPFIGVAFGLFVAITTNIGADFYTHILPMSLEILVVFALMQILDNMFFQPMIFSNSVRAHPLEIFILILMAGTVAGIPGMILAIPSYTIFRVVAKEFLSEFKVIQRLTKNI